MYQTYYNVKHPCYENSRVFVCRCCSRLSSPALRSGPVRVRVVFCPRLSPQSSSWSCMRAPSKYLNDAIDVSTAIKQTRPLPSVISCQPACTDGFRLTGRGLCWVCQEVSKPSFWGGGGGEIPFSQAFSTAGKTGGYTAFCFPSLVF